MTAPTLPNLDADTDVDSEVTTRRRVPTAAEMRLPKADLFRPPTPPPCSESELWVRDPDAWFHDGRYSRTIREAAIEVCADCPFRGRCAFNAVASGATHGVWAGIELPGDRPKKLAAYYALLLAKFEERRAEEIGEQPVTKLSADDHYRRGPRSPRHAA